MAQDCSPTRIRDARVGNDDCDRALLGNTRPFVCNYLADSDGLGLMLGVVKPYEKLKHVLGILGMVIVLMLVPDVFMNLGRTSLCGNGSVLSS
jgi:hypothetical protein